MLLRFSLVPALVAACSLIAPSASQAQTAEVPSGLVMLPEARHDAMLAALRVELAGQARVIEGACPSEGCASSSVRVAAEAQGASQTKKLRLL